MPHQLYLSVRPYVRVEVDLAVCGEKNYLYNNYRVRFARYREEKKLLSFSEIISLTCTADVCERHNLETNENILILNFNMY